MGLLDRPRLTARSDGLDLLRFGLALYVILTHLAEWGPLTHTGVAPALRSFDAASERLLQGHGETHPAVVAFIVLSGYCIHRNGARRNRWDWRRYAVKRSWRIVPVYLAASALGVALFLVAHRANPTAATAASGTVSITARGLAMKLTALTALVPIPHLASNGLNGYEGNGPLYTVAAEMWLYAVYAVAMSCLLSGRISQRRATGWLAIASISGFALAAAVPSLRQWWWNASVLGFLPLWWLGSSAVGRRLGGRAILWLAIGWLVASVYLLVDGSFVVEVLRVGAFGVLIAALVQRLDGRRLRLPEKVAWPGRAGYSLYAFHAPVLIVLVALGVAWPIVLAAALVAGLAGFRLVEAPATAAARIRRGSAERPRPAAPLIESFH